MKNINEAPISLLSLGYCFPPVASAESYVTARIMGNLPNSRVDHIGANPILLSGREDRSLENYVMERFNNVYMIEASSSIKLLNSVFRSLPLRPDRWIMLNNATYKKALELAPNRYNAIVTRSQYHSIHLVGQKLKSKFPDIPWIACFSDPWTGGDHSRNVPFFSLWSKRMEKRTLELADALIFPTEGLAEFFARNNTSADVLSKAHIIPHTIDHSLLPSLTTRCSRTRKIVGRCFGSFYGPRRVAPLLKGLRALLEQYPYLKDKITLELIGANIEVTHQIKLYKLEEYISVKPNIDWFDALSLMSESDFLILVEAPSIDPSFYMPSKLIDYISVGRPIFAISPNGDSSDIVRASGGVVISPDQSDMTLAKGLKKILSLPAGTNIQENFNASLLGQRMEDIIRTLIVSPLS